MTKITGFELCTCEFFFTIKHQLNVCNINDPSRNEEEPFFSKFLNPSPEAGDFQNLTTYHLSTDTSVEKY